MEHYTTPAPAPPSQQVGHGDNGYTESVLNTSNNNRREANVGVRGSY